jgi:CcmD family protein
MKLATYAFSSEGTLEALAVSDQPSGEQRSTEFHAVEGGTETMDGPTLLVEAYAALWLILFAFIFVSWRRQSRLDARIDELERALSSSRSTAGLSK